jgi:hypothetical protein
MTECLFDDKQHLPEMIRILKRAKKRLSTGRTEDYKTQSYKTPFVCNAVLETQGYFVAQNLLVEWIAAMLKHDGVCHNTYERWLYAAHGINAHSDKFKRQASRHAWVDWMIGHLEESK